MVYMYLSTLKSTYSYTSYVQETKHSDPLSLIPQCAIETCTIYLILTRMRSRWHAIAKFPRSVLMLLIARKIMLLSHTLTRWGNHVASLV